jgi:predicted nucleic acid-binding protein
LIYFDTSALTKLAITEDESEALESWLTDRPGVPHLSSDIVLVELPRAVMRRQPTMLLATHRLVTELDTIALTPQLLETAATLQPPALRSLDAIHLATALTARRHLTAFVTYDKRMVHIATDSGLPVVSPN